MKVLNILLIIGLLYGCTPDDKEPQIKPDLSSATTAAQVIQNMGSGFNLGNTFDNGLQSTNPETIKPIIDKYQGAGMKHIRIPVTWFEGFNGNTLADSKGVVNFKNPRFIQLKEVIDYALSKDLYVVINAHHERQFNEKYDGSKAMSNQFSNLWSGIAEYFKDYPDKLIFELLNEPQGSFGDTNGGPTPADPNALALTRKMYRVGHEAVRNTGGANASRVIMISTNGMGNHQRIRSVYPTKAELPGEGSDNFLAIQVHTYDPWSFCGQNGRIENYPGKAEVEASLKSVITHANNLGVPLNYGEFGIGRAEREEERNTQVAREYYKTIVQTTLAAGMSSTVWDDRGWFGLIKKDGPNSELSFVFDIVPYMLQNE